MNNYNKSAKEYQAAPQGEPQGNTHVPAGAKKRQVELSDDDFAHLNAAQFSDQAWEDVARKHGFDPATRELIPNSNNRSYMALPKKWAPKPQKGGILTTAKLGR